MESLNFNHLYYFWVVAKEGSIANACQRLKLAQPTISAQIRALEKALNEDLFDRSGRKLVLTETGRMIAGYAEEMFSLSKDMLTTLRGGNTGDGVSRFTIGVADVLPKMIVHKLLEPVQHLRPTVVMTCREGKPAELLSRLAVYEFDMIITDAPIGSQAKVRAYNHLLGESGVSVVAAPRLAQNFRESFPESLDGAPMLLQTDNTNVRRNLDLWFEKQGYEPLIVSEFEDTALLKVFAKDGAGLFVTPTVIADSVCRQFGVEVVGELPEVKEQFYAISVERKVKHPALQAIVDTARGDVFAKMDQLGTATV